jgi:excisionase family DNA binding protein
MESQVFKYLMTIQEACEYSNLSRRHLRFLLEKGKIQGKKLGRDWITTKEEIDKYLSTNPKPGRKPQTN